MKIKIDLFSDTNTNPSQAMRQAMANAKVGNEVAGEDPSVNLLLEKVCTLLNKPAAAFMPSGSMCNGVAYRSLCQPGDRIILDETAHSVSMSAGLISGLVGAQPELIKGKRGIFSVSQLETAIGKNKGYNIAKAKIVSIEQTTNLGGGAIWPLSDMSAICDYAHMRGLYTHMDGARLLNASTATGIKPADYAQNFDSIWIDFAKGLGAPMGAVIAGEQSFIDKVWFYKFQQGGAMHQAGILAAGCLYALNNNIDKLIEDHNHTKLLARLLSENPCICLDLHNVETNILIFSIVNSKLTAYQVSKNLLEKGIRLLALDDKRLRAILHMDISADHVHEVAISLKNILENTER